MADNKVFKIKVDGIEREVQNLKDLKTALKQAKDEQVQTALQFGEGSKQFKEATKNVSALRDKLEDLSDSTRSLQGSGIEKASSGFNLLGEGLRNLDFDKVKVGLTAMKTALASTGIMLLVQGITYLIQNFDELSQGTGIVAKVLQGVGAVIDKVGQAVTWLTDKLNLSNSTLDKNNKAVIESASKTKEVLADQNKEYDRQIAVVRAAGKETIELERQKYLGIIRTNEAIAKQIAAQIKATIAAGEAISQEQSRLLKESFDNIKEAGSQLAVLNATHNKKLIDSYKKANEDKKKSDFERDSYYRDLLDKQAEYEKKVNEERERDYRKTGAEIRTQTEQMLKSSADAQLESASKELLAYDNKQAELKAKEQVTFSDKLAQLENEKQAKLNNTQLTEEERIAIIQEYDKKEGDLKQARLDQNVALAKQGLRVTQDLTDLFFDHQLRRNKGNAEKEREIKKKQFQLNKAFSLTQVILDTVMGGIKALSQNPPPNPIGIISAALIGLAGTAASIKIGTTKFEDGGSSASASGGDAVPSMPSLPAPPSGGTAPQVNQQPSTKLDEAGKNLSTSQRPIIIENKILETDITESQQRVERLESQAKFG